MSLQRAVDLSEAPVVDAHCHGFEVDKLLDRDPGRWMDRITLMGMCFASAKSLDRKLSQPVSMMAERTIFAMLGLRWLADFLGCAIEELPQVRHSALEANPKAYISRLLSDECIKGLLVDDGYPLPRVEPEKLEAVVGTRVHRVTRIEPLIDEARNVTNNVQDLEEAFRALLEEAAQDPRCVAFKSVIAYRTGLDVGSPSRDRVALSYRRWKEAEWREGRETSKDLRDHLLNVTFEIASRADRPVHIHTGAGDADVVLAYARPSNLASLLMRFSAHPVVLIHSGYPWLEEATYLASIYPMAYLELSLTLSWPTLDIDRGLNLILGSVPTSKVLYGSDTSYEPEVLWISAKLARAALGRVLGCAVERNYLTQKEAERVGRSVLAGNVIRLHGLTD